MRGEGLEQGDPCPECGQAEVCARCKSSIADIVYRFTMRHVEEVTGELFQDAPALGKGWFDE